MSGASFAVNDAPPGQLKLALESIRKHASAVFSRTRSIVFVRKCMVK